MAYLFGAILVLLALIFYKLVTTNHWTVGKKLMVLLTGSLFICMANNLGYALGLIGIPGIALGMTPFIATLVLMVAVFYQKREIEH